MLYYFEMIKLLAQAGYVKTRRRILDKLEDAGQFVRTFVKRRH